MLYYSSVSERADDPMKPEEWVKKLKLELCNCSRKAAWVKVTVAYHSLKGFQQVFALVCYNKNALEWMT
jgi:hypothetical protein